MNERFTHHTRLSENIRRTGQTVSIRPVFAALTLALVLNGCTEQQGYRQLSGYAQGGTWSVKYNAAGVKARQDEVQKGIEAILKDIDTTLSGYNKGSQLSRLNAGDTIRPSGMLIAMYDYGYNVWKETEGAVDVAAGPLFDIWGFGFKNDSLPSAGKVAATMAASGMRRLVPTMEEALTEDGRLYRERLVRNDGTTEGPVLNFNAVAQGYSCDTVASYLSKLGVRDMLVDIGEIWCRGVNPSGKPWKIGVDRPKDGNNTPGADLDGIWESAGNGGQGIVTSGNYRKFYVKDGRKVSHTIDPRSGYPAENSLLSATVTAPTAAAADAYATYCMVIGYEASKRFIESRADLEGYLIYATPDGGMAEWASPGFRLVK